MRFPDESLVLMIREEYLAKDNWWPGAGPVYRDASGNVERMKRPRRGLRWMRWGRALDGLAGRISAFECKQC